jgi:SpoVK/Ycf46/Vps4 family AAA+-type ATPase
MTLKHAVEHPPRRTRDFDADTPSDYPSTMATSEMLQELIRAHVSGDTDRFRQIALQVAAREARVGHRVVAGKIRDLIEHDEPVQAPIPLARAPRDLRNILAVSYPDVPLDHVVLRGAPAVAVDRLLAEHHGRARLAEWGLTPRRHLLFHGPPGTGKTMTASAVAAEISLPLIRIRVETLFSRYMGETAALLTDVFEQAGAQRGVYLFDEFDAIAKQRGDTQDVGEARRIVSTFLQLLDADEGESLIIAATNTREVLDEALFRRFDDVVLFGLPDEPARAHLLALLTASHGLTDSSRSALARQAAGLSHAEITRAVTDAVKAVVLSGRRKLRKADVAAALAEMTDRRAPAA